MEKQVVPISVLIPSMNRLQSLERTLNGYVQADWIPRQIVVVDQTQDAATAQEICQMVQSLSTDIVMTYVYQQTPSLPAARNNALRCAMEDVIVCSDDDVDIYKDTIKMVWEIMQNPAVAMVAGLDDNMGCSKTDIGYLLGTKSFRNRKIGHVTASVLGRYPDVVSGQVDTQWAMGYFFAVRKSLLEKWNLRWDENLTGYAFSEDLDFSYAYHRKAAAEGMRCILDERVHVCHLVSQEYRIPSKKHTYGYVMNRAYISVKHKMGWKSAIAMEWCDFWRLVERILRRRNPKDLWDALRFKHRHWKEISQGILNYPS